MSLMDLFIKTVKREIKIFIFWCIIFTVFRFAFIFLFIDNNIVDMASVLQALYLGVRLSLKTVGILCLVGGLLSFIPKLKLELWWHSLCIAFFTLCFSIRIPYYKQFHNAFDIMLINGMHDDKKAIWQTMVDQFQFWPRLGACVALSMLLIWIFNKYYKYIVKMELPIGSQKNSNILVKFGCAVMTIAALGIFCRYGGAFDYAHSINWESAARLKSHLLNEAILDDGQALYRVRSMKKRMQQVAKVEFSSDELEKKLALIGGKPGFHSINKALQRYVEQPLLNKQPKQIVLVLGESFGMWPFLSEFEPLNLVTNSKGLLNNSLHVEDMLAHGSGTISTVNGFLTGLPDTGIYANYNKRILSEPQPTGIAYLMQSLGYKTVFWYGGFSEWQNIKNVVLSQSFMEFHCADEFSYAGGNSWGCPDKYLFNEIAKYMEQHNDEKMFHMVLTATNHPPYTLDVVKEGFPKDQVKEKLPYSVGKDEASLMELGHMWYADQALGMFVARTEKQLPDTLYVITGDHSDRFNFATEQDNYTKSAVPCIFYGKGLTNKSIRAGSHLQIMPTLMELVAPKGTKYCSFVPSMFNEDCDVYNYTYFISKGATKHTLLKHQQAPKELQEKIAAAVDVAAWRIVKGDRY